MNDRIYSPHNTASDPAETKLLAGMEAEGIYAQERQGQAQVLASTTLPTESYTDDSEFEALGFTFGAQVPGDPLFREATLPEGWSRKGTEHSMHSEIVDERGIVRASIFYKAAFYDRKASLSLAHVGGSFVTNWMYGDETPEFNPLFTDDELQSILQRAQDELSRIDEHPTYEKYRPRLASLLAAVKDQIAGRDPRG